MQDLSLRQQQDLKEPGSGPDRPQPATLPGSRPEAAIFDVDGVLLASPHEQAWREALAGLADPARFTTAIYQAEVAGKPRQAGALAALQALGVADAEAQAASYAVRKQKRLEALIRSGPVATFPDALRFVEEVAALGWPMAVASSSRNANAMLRPIRVPSGRLLLELFSANLCGRSFPRGKPDPEIFFAAAAALQIDPRRCVVIEDAPAGIRAARAGNMTGLGVARLSDQMQLQAAGADLVVTSLDDVDLGALVAGRFGARPS